MNWKQAMTLGLLAPGVWEGERVPVAYSYNGVVLPNIYKVYTPELQKTHPYAFIECYAYGDSVHAVLWVNSEPLGICSFGSVLGDYMGTVGNTVWSRMKSTLCDKGVIVSAPTFGDEVVGSGNTYVTAQDVLWANYDVQNYVDGTLLLAASEPVPVYE